jgi:hypothetical protein
MRVLVVIEEQLATMGRATRHGPRLNVDARTRAQDHAE